MYSYSIVETCLSKLCQTDPLRKAKVAFRFRYVDEWKKRKYNGDLKNTQKKNASACESEPVRCTWLGLTSFGKFT